MANNLDPSSGCSPLISNTSPLPPTTNKSVTFKSRRNIGLSIAHINIRGIINKLDELKLIIETHNLKILHVCETFLTPSISSHVLNIPNFSIIRRDRIGRHGGGILTYIHNSLQFTAQSHLDNILPEALTIKITQPSAKPFLTSVIYRPPNSASSWVDSFTQLISHCRNINNELIVMGDFNINLAVSNNSWCNTINQLGLLQLIKKHTRIQANSKSLIDHIYVSKCCNVIHSDVVDIGLSDHCLVYMERKLGNKSFLHKPRTKITYLDWKHFSENAFQQELSEISWNDIYLTNSSDSMLNLFYSKLKTIISKHLKEKSRFVKSTITPPWLDDEVRRSINLRDSLKHNKKWPEYKQQRNYTTNLIRRKKKKHVADLICQSQGKQTKQLWEILRNTSRSNTLPTIFQEGDARKPLSDGELATLLNTHFSNIANKLTPSVNQDNVSFPSINKSELLNLSPITPAQVVLYFKDIPVSKATGSDHLSVRILRLAMPFIINPLTDIINQAISEGTFPSQWKTAVVTPLHKSGDANNVSNYRPISVLPVLSKIYEKHILHHLNQFLTSHNIISNHQSGFRKNHSCTTVMHHLISEWSMKTKSKDTVILLFLDFSKAFDMVNHQIAIQKLRSIGIGGNFISVIQSYLTNRTQRVRVKSSLSPTLPITSGVPQGAILAPTIFQIFINDLLSLPLSCSVHAYADDTTFYIAGKDANKLQQHVNADLHLIQNWCRMNRMVLNSSKSHFLVLNAPSTNLSFKLNDTPLQEKSSTKLLGFFLNNTLKWDDHILEISKKVSSNLRLFYNIRHLMNTHTSKLYYFAYIHSYLSYGISIYYPMSFTKHTNPLFNLQKKALRLICAGLNKHGKYIATKDTVSHTGILPLPSLSEYSACLMAHSIKTGSCPPYLTQQHQHRISTITRYQHKLPSSSNYSSINLHLVKSFNNLPSKLRSTVNPRTFRRNLKLHLLSE